MTTGSEEEKYNDEIAIRKINPRWWTPQFIPDVQHAKYNTLKFAIRCHQSYLDKGQMVPQAHRTEEDNRPVVEIDLKGKRYCSLKPYPGGGVGKFAYPSVNVAVTSRKTPRSG